MVTLKLAPDPHCPLSDLAESMCAHCRGHLEEPPVDERLTEDDIGQRFTAHYDGYCGAGCGGGITAGEIIAALTDGSGYACPGCLP